MANRSQQSRRIVVARRRAAVLALVVVCLGLVSLLSMTVVVALHNGHQANRQRIGRAQTRQLAIAGLNRGAAQYAADRDYAGETWTPDPEALPGDRLASVVIAIGPPDESTKQRELKSVATYGEGPQRVRVTLTSQLETTDE